MKARERRLAELRRGISEITPQEAFALQARGAALVDVHEADEIAQGCPAGALRLGRGYLELRIEEAVADPARQIVVLCGSGTRSLFAAEDLVRLGYARVASMGGGFSRWKAERLAIEVPFRLDAGARERHRDVRLFAKLESVNPGGSVKDRPVARMLLEAHAAGRFENGRRLLDSSSGTAGISYAMLGAAPARS